MARKKIRDDEYKKAYIREYLKVYGPSYANTTIGKYVRQKAKAKNRGIAWDFSFEDWCELWQISGHWNERGSNGYQMCRKGDVGSYSISNVYIAHHSQNKKDAIENVRSRNNAGRFI